MLNDNYSPTSASALTSSAITCSARVPLSKIFCYTRLLPGMLQGEDEYTVIGGLYEVGIAEVKKVYGLRVETAMPQGHSLEI